MSVEPIKHDRHFWEQHVTQFKNSGLSKAQYCREHQLTYHQFVYWVPQFLPLNDEPSPAARTAKRFVPLSLVPSAQPAELEITLPSGVQISGITEHTSALAITLIAQL